MITNLPIRARVTKEAWKFQTLAQILFDLHLYFRYEPKDTLHLLQGRFSITWLGILSGAKCL